MESNVFRIVAHDITVPPLEALGVPAGTAGAAWKGFEFGLVVSAPTYEQRLQLMYGLFCSLLYVLSSLAAYRVKLIELPASAQQSLNRLPHGLAGLHLYHTLDQMCGSWAKKAYLDRLLEVVRPMAQKTSQPM